MPITLELLDANATLAILQATIQHAETRGYQLLAFATGLVGRRRANLLTLLQAASSAASHFVSLEIIDGGLSKDQQEATLNSSGKQVVCYGSLYVEGRARNVAGYRG